MGLKQNSANSVKESKAAKGVKKSVTKIKERKTLYDLIKKQIKIINL